ncbi:MAG: glutamate-1-semialdehyde 2,1-aminomutase [Polyangiales bacterium]
MTTRSTQLYQAALQHFPGGVNSPVRAFGAVEGTPPFIASAAGAYLQDEDGRRYIDCVGSWGPMILGHAHPKVVEAVQARAQLGLSFGAPTAIESALAEAVQAAMPAIEMLRFTCSGTEAVMGALRAARGFTGRDWVVKCTGAYHGGADYLLVKAGSGAATHGEPDSAGVPAAFAACTRLLPYNDLAAAKAEFAAHGERIAAIIVEPVAGNMGCVPPDVTWLQGLRQLCDAAGALLVFDEVMTGFRVARGGAQARYAVRPDLTCLGKIIGGGMPVGAYGGRRDVMQRVSPSGPVYQAGTLSGHPVAMAAGLATLEALAEPGVYERLEVSCARVAAALTEAAAAHAVPCQVQRVGAMLTAFFTDTPVRGWQDASRADTARFARFHRALLAAGVYWPPSQFEAAFLSLAHTGAALDALCAAFAPAFAALTAPAAG